MSDVTGDGLPYESNISRPITSLISAAVIVLGGVVKSIEEGGAAMTFSDGDEAIAVGEVPTGSELTVNSTSSCTVV